MQAKWMQQPTSASAFANVRPRQTVYYLLGTLQSTLVSFGAMAVAKANIMITARYFGHFADLSRDHCAAEVGRWLADDAKIHEAIANDLWNQGFVLAHRDYWCLRRADQVPLLGAFSTAVASVWIWMGLAAVTGELQK